MSADVLIWQAPTRTMNPSIPEQLVDQALADDPASASAEWLAIFRSDLDTLLAREALDAVVIRGRFELPPVPGIAYVGFVDPSGGSADSFTLAIAHRDAAGVPVLDLVREVRPPFSPEAVVLQFAQDLKRYSVSTITGDRYAGEWPREQFQKCGVEYQTSELTRSELYLEALPLINSGAVELLDHSRLLGQLSGLERRVGRSGKDAVDHRPGSHDDVANAAAGALVHAVRSMGLATLPATFTRCNRAISIEGFSATHCYVLGGAVVPPNDICCKDCVGRLYVEAAKEAFQKRSGTFIDRRSFVREHLDIEGNDFAARVIQTAWLAKDHGF